jgi:hypothetical protein
MGDMGMLKLGLLLVEPTKHSLGVGQILPHPAYVVGIQR